MTAAERSAHLRRWHDLMLAHTEDLARLMTAEQGKPLAEARGEVAYGASFIDWFAEEGRRVYGDVIPTATGRQAHPGAEAARGGLCRHHPLELPHRHDHPQGGRCTEGGVYSGGLAGGTDALLGPGTGGPGGAGWATARGLQRRHRPARTHRGRADEQSDGPQVELHRVHASWAAPHATVCRYPQAPVPGTGTSPPSSSTTPTWTRPWRGRSSPSTATPGRPAFLPTASWSDWDLRRLCPAPGGQGRELRVGPGPMPASPRVR